MRLGLGLGLGGRGGGVVAFDPSALGADLVAWWDGSDSSTITESGGNISQVDDKSGNGNHLVQASAPDQPTVGIGTLGGNSFINFTAAQELAVGSALSGTTGTNVDIWIVFQSNDGTGGIFHSGTAAAAGFSLAMRSGDTSTVLSSNYGAPKYYKNGAKQSFTTRADAYTAYVTSTLLTRSDFGANISTWPDFIYNGYTSNFNLNHQFGEMLVTEALSTAQRNQIGEYLASKWGLTWAEIPTSSTIQSIVSSAVIELDATDAYSYVGTGPTWDNMIINPADGSAQTAYDVFLGADGTSSATDPTFTGTAGSSSAYFALDGGDYFTSVNNNPSFFSQAHHSDAEGWFAVALNLPTGALAALCDLRRSTTPNYGVYLRADADGTLTFLSSNSGGTEILSSAEAIANATDTLVIVSYSATTTRVWVNTSTATETAWVVDTDTTNLADEKFRLGAIYNGTQINPSGTRYYHFSAGNTLLTDTDAANIIAYLNAKHGRTYA